MHDIELWVVLTVSVALGILTGLAVQFFFAPYLKKKILLESDPMKLQPGSKVNFSCGDTGKMNYYYYYYFLNNFTFFRVDN